MKKIEIKITENADKKIEFTAEKNWKGEIKIVRTINRNGRFLHIDTIATIESGEMKIKVENGTDIYGNKKFSMKNYKTEKKINESLSVWGITLDEIKTAIENFSEEVDASEYAVSTEAQEIAINAEIENARAAENEIDDLDTRIEDEIFQQAEIINHQAEQISECAAAVEGGEMTIEGKVVNIADKNGKPHYYSYTWDGSSEFNFDTSLLPISKKTAEKIAAEWNLNHGEISFEEFMTASNDEYKKIRKLYLSNGGGIAREYDKKLSEELKAEKLFVSLPKENFSEQAIENFKLILASKANLIKDALGISTVEIKISENDLKFEWFSPQTKTEEMQAYKEFLCKVGELAKIQKRVTAKEREVENKKYAFRCFLLRIGMIGDEFKTCRKILLKNLSGSSAFKNGSRGLKEV